MRKRLMLASWGVAALVLLMVGVATARARERYTEEFHHTYPIRADGDVGLENVNGDIQVLAWDRNEVRVDAVKSARTEAELSEIEINVKTSPASLHIKTEYPHHFFRNDSGAVDYKLMVPRQIRLDGFELVNGGLEIEDVAGDVKAASVNGRLTTRGLSGEVRLSVVNGSLEVRFDRPDISKPVKLSSVNGRLALTLPPDANAELSASTVNGGISNDFNLPARRSGFVGHELEGKLGNGGGHVELSSVNGSIEIRRASQTTN